MGNELGHFEVWSTKGWPSHCPGNTTFDQRLGPLLALALLPPALRCPPADRPVSKTNFGAYLEIAEPIPGGSFTKSYAREVTSYWLTNVPSSAFLLLEVPSGLGQKKREKSQTKSVSTEEHLCHTGPIRISQERGHFMEQNAILKKKISSLLLGTLKWSDLEVCWSSSAIGPSQNSNEVQVFLKTH